VIVFDEATSALDAETEAAVMDAINHLNNKTLIIAAHRLSTLNRCDAVYEVKNGRLMYVGRGETLSQHQLRA
jgi:ABC-type bacteriocin/lantibiotic exporter with double-glycine peptidase domain